MASEFVRKVKGIRNIDILSPNITTENDLISTIDGKVYVATNKGYKKITGSDTEQDIQVLEKDVKNLKTSTGNNTSEIETLKTDTNNNTSEIKTLKTDTDNNTSKIKTLNTSTDDNGSKIRTLETKTGNNTSEIDTLKTSTDNNTSDIETLKTTTGNNTSEIDTLTTKTDDNTDLINSLTTQLEELKNNIKQYYTLFNGSTNGVGSTIPLNDDYTTYDKLYITGSFPGGVFTDVVMVKEIIDNIAIQRINLRDSDGTFLGAYEIKLTPNTNTELEIANDVSWDELGSEGTGQDRNAYTILNIEGVK